MITRDLSRAPAEYEVVIGTADEHVVTATACDAILAVHDYEEVVGALAGDASHDCQGGNLLTRWRSERLVRSGQDAAG